jgi:hypothetical protein
MVTPRKPNAKRGAPPVAWADDPDRYSVAMIAALDAFGASSKRQCSLLAAALALGQRDGDISPSDLHPDKIGEIYLKKFGRGQSTTKFSGRAAALRKKYRTAGYDPVAAHWLIVMAGILMLLIGAKDRQRVLRESMRRASTIGEEAFVHNLLVSFATGNTPSEFCNR